MAQLYYRHGIHEQESLFDHFFRSYPNYGEHQAGYDPVLPQMTPHIIDLYYISAPVGSPTSGRSPLGPASPVPPPTPGHGC